jgi:hypothetical protein
VGWNIRTSDTGIKGGIDSVAIDLLFLVFLGRAEAWYQFRRVFALRFHS